MRYARVSAELVWRESQRVETKIEVEGEFGFDVDWDED